MHIKQAKDVAGAMTQSRLAAQLGEALSKMWSSRGLLMSASSLRLMKGGLSNLQKVTHDSFFPSVFLLGRLDRTQ